MDNPKKEHRPPVDVKGAATYTGFGEGYLNKLRCKGGGPVYLKRNGVVRYDLDDLDDWLAAGKRKSTSDSREVAA
ncbi:MULTISPECIES: hypothetical protein [unclassified Bradyrhizobium]|uniref:hypothetical protein n=1 Tax=unclassified Bradyrhizobium TaxID=2631580 RepID=UPI001FF884CB|nr:MULTISPECIES: hypothetical protein [unclassified Bradyrhizobium]MCK1304712.1 DNA-binding protein [Bradyrhizobium sp. 45]MCK1608569.1 DNA-binding protein [Bradyrhizobium sp. 163]MCK1766341.1 DNA-binding protein [Bradyrhizobium sp. 136]